MTATVKTAFELNDELHRGGKIMEVSGTATVMLILIQRFQGQYEFWSVTP